MIGFDRKDAGGSFEERLVGNQRCRAFKGGYPHILENKGAEQEVLVIGIGIEGLAGADQSGRARGGRESAVRIGADVDRRLGDRRSPECASKELDMGAFVGGDLRGILHHLRVAEGHLASTCDRALSPGAGQDVRRQARAEEGKIIELRLEIFEVEGEVEDVGVGRRRLGVERPAVQGQDKGSRHCGRRRHLEERASVIPPLGARLHDLDEIGTFGHSGLPDLI